MPATILHVSDLHRDSGSKVTTDSLLESLRRDRDRYIAEGVCQRPDLAIVSGDIVYGVAPDAPDAEQALRRQYEEANAFLVALAGMFFGGDRGRVVVLPGNHDVSFAHVHRATQAEPLPTTEEKRALLLQELWTEGTDWRWVWKDFSVRRVVDRPTYDRRLEAFANFYAGFYEGQRTFSLDPSKQFAIHEFPMLRLVVAALSTCCDNDPFNRTGRIHPDCVAGATREVARRVKQGWAAVATWHHSLAGGPKESDYVDADVLQSLMDGGFVLGLHGHQHRPNLLEHRFTADRKRSIAVVSAGTLCGGPRSLPSGRRRAYNLIKLDLERKVGAVHVRDMRNDTFSMPVWGAAHVVEFSGPLMEFELALMPAEASIVQIAAEAAERLRKGDARDAYLLVQPYVADGLARRVAVESLLVLGDWSGIRDLCSPPESPAEFVALADALYSLHERQALRDLIDRGATPFAGDAGVAQCIELMRTRLRGR